MTVTYERFYFVPGKHKFWEVYYERCLIYVAARGECQPPRMDDSFLLRFLRARRSVPARAHRLVSVYVLLIIINYKAGQILFPQTKRRVWVGVHLFIMASFIIFINVAVVYAHACQRVFFNKKPKRTLNATIMSRICSTLTLSADHRFFYPHLEEKVL